MRKSAAAIWQTVHSERRRLAADLTKLRDDQWRVSSLCPGWDIHDVLAHLVDTALTGRVSFIRDLLIARMDFDRANANGIARVKRADPQVTAIPPSSTTAISIGAFGRRLAMSDSKRPCTRIVPGVSTVASIVVRADAS